MVAYGAGSVVCSLFSGYIPAGSVGRSMVQEGAGGKTQVRRRCYRQNVMTMSNTMYKMELLHIFLKTKWTGEGAFFHPEQQSWISQCIDTWYLFNNILGYAILLLLNSTLQLLSNIVLSNKPWKVTHYHSSLLNEPSMNDLYFPGGVFVWLSCGLSCYHCYRTSILSSTKGIVMFILHWHFIYIYFFIYIFMLKPNWPVRGNI